jgi:hypothetical protein
MRREIVVKKASWNTELPGSILIVEFDDENIYLPMNNCWPPTIDAYKLKDASIQVIDEEVAPTFGDVVNSAINTIWEVDMLFDKSDVKASDLQKQRLIQKADKYSDKKVTFVLKVKNILYDEIKFVGELYSKDFKELQIAAI